MSELTGTSHELPDRGVWRRLLPAVIVAVAVRVVISQFLNDFAGEFVGWFVMFTILFWPVSGGILNKTHGRSRVILRFAGAALFATVCATAIRWVLDSLFP